MTISEASALYAQNMTFYAGRVPAPSKETTALQVSVWAATLADIPASAAQAALVRAFTVCRFPVTLADLMEQLHAMQAESEPRAGEVWQQITEAAHRARENKGLYSFTGKDAAGRRISDAAKEANKQLFELLPAPARQWLGSLQLLIDLDREDAAGTSIRRREFERFYKEYQETRPLDPAQLAELPGGRNDKQLQQNKNAALRAANTQNGKR